MNLYKFAVSARAKMSAGHIYVKYNITLSILEKEHIFDKEKKSWTVTKTDIGVISSDRLFHAWFTAVSVNLNSKWEDISSFYFILQKSAIYCYRKTAIENFNQLSDREGSPRLFQLFYSDQRIMGAIVNLTWNLSNGISLKITSKNLFKNH